MNSLVIRNFEAHEWPLYREVRLRALADAPEAFCSTLASEQRRPDQDWAARLSAAAVSGQDLPLIAERAGAALGMLWAKVDASDPAVVNVFQVWVAPEARGLGVAAALLHAVVAWAREKGARAIALSVTCDSAAARLYRREGFVDVGPPTPRNPGLPLLEQSMRLDIRAA
jgi:GNAT superfamily N-acetyltransferase